MLNSIHVPKTVPCTIIAYTSQLIPGFIYIIVEISCGHQDPSREQLHSAESTRVTENGVTAKLS